MVNKLICEPTKLSVLEFNTFYDHRMSDSLQIKTGLEIYKYSSGPSKHLWMSINHLYFEREIIFDGETVERDVFKFIILAKDIMDREVIERELLKGRIVKTLFDIFGGVVELNTEYTMEKSLFKKIIECFMEEQADSFWNFSLTHIKNTLIGFEKTATKTGGKKK